MKTFLVLWVVVNSYMVPCEFENKPDIYGRSDMFSAIPAVACYETEKTEHQLEFKTRSEALAFIKEAEERCDECSDFKLYEEMIDEN